MSRYTALRLAIAVSVVLPSFASGAQGQQLSYIADRTETYSQNESQEMTPKVQLEMVNVCSEPIPRLNNLPGCSFDRRHSL
jgi:hypothetical protein